MSIKSVIILVAGLAASAPVCLAQQAQQQPVQAAPGGDDAKRAEAIKHYQAFSAECKLKGDDGCACGCDSKGQNCGVCDGGTCFPPDVSSHTQCAR